MNTFSWKNRDAAGKDARQAGRDRGDNAVAGGPGVVAQRALQERLGQSATLQSQADLSRRLNQSPRAVAQRQLSEALASRTAYSDGAPGPTPERGVNGDAVKQRASEIERPGSKNSGAPLLQRVVQMVQVSSLVAPDDRFFKVKRPDEKVWIGQLNRIESGYHWFRDIEGNDYGVMDGDVEPITDPPDYTANQLLSILRNETPGGNEFYQGVLESVPKTPTVDLADGVTHTDMGTFDILIDYHKSKRQALTSLVFELSNAAAWKEFNDLDKMAAAGRVSKQTYWREIERMEFENAFYNQFVWLLNNMKNKSWGAIDQASQALLLNYRGLTFPQYIEKSQEKEGFLDHVQNSTDRWEAKYQAAYELYASSGGKEFYQPKKATTALPYFELPSEKKG